MQWSNQEVPVLQWVQTLTRCEMRNFRRGCLCDSLFQGKDCHKTVAGKGHSLSLHCLHFRAKHKRNVKTNKVVDGS